MSKVSERWVPKLPSEEQKRDRVKICKEILSMYKADNEFLNRIITGDELWFHYYESESKSQTKRCKRRDEPVRIKVKAAPSASKSMVTVIWNSESILLHTAYQRKPQLIEIVISKNRNNESSDQTRKEIFMYNFIQPQESQCSFSINRSFADEIFLYFCSLISNFGI